MNKIIGVAVIVAIVIGIVIAYKGYQNSSIEGNQISIAPVQNAINSTTPQPTTDNSHKVIHITLNDGMGVKSP